MHRYWTRSFIDDRTENDLLEGALDHKDGTNSDMKPARGTSNSNLADTPGLFKLAWQTVESVHDGDVNISSSQRNILVHDGYGDMRKSATLWHGRI